MGYPHPGVHPEIYHPMYTRGYTTLCTPRDIPPYVHPGYTHLPRYTPVYTPSTVTALRLHGMIAVHGDSLLGSRREKPSGESLYSLSGPQECYPGREVSAQSYSSLRVLNV